MKDTIKLYLLMTAWGLTGVYMFLRLFGVFA